MNAQVVVLVNPVLVDWCEAGECVHHVQESAPREWSSSVTAHITLRFSKSNSICMDQPRKALDIIRPYEEEKAERQFRRLKWQRKNNEEGDKDDGTNYDTG
jgi:hypothetical protein